MRGTNYTLTERDIARFWPKVDRAADCWNWTASCFSNGYGYFYLPTKPRSAALAHRVAWQLLRGSLPLGLELDHLCRNRACVNPQHLEPVTHRENSLRGVGVSALAVNRTHCPQGHGLSGDNLYLTPSGTRQCRTCRRVHARRMDEKRKAARASR